MLVAESAYAIAQEQFDRAADVLDLDEGLRKVLREVKDQVPIDGAEATGHASHDRRPATIMR